MRRLRASLGLLVTTLVLTGAAPAVPVSEEAAARVASQLRCVVCQNLSVADSPSEMARQMREVIRDRLAQGESEEQVLRYFEERYGEWIRLSPRSWLVWVLPFVGLFAGLGVVLLITLRWSRRAREAQERALSPAERERIRVELNRLDE